MLKKILVGVLILVIAAVATYFIIKFAFGIDILQHIAFWR